MRRRVAFQAKQHPESVNAQGSADLEGCEPPRRKRRRRHRPLVRRRDQVDVVLDLGAALDELSDSGPGGDEDKRSDHDGKHASGTGEPPWPDDDGSLGERRF